MTCIIRWDIARLPPTLELNNKKSFGTVLIFLGKKIKTSLKRHAKLRGDKCHLLILDEICSGLKLKLEKNVQGLNVALMSKR